MDALQFLRISIYDRKEKVPELSPKFPFLQISLMDVKGMHVRMFLNKFNELMIIFINL